MSNNDANINMNNDGELRKMKKQIHEQNKKFREFEETNEATSEELRKTNQETWRLVKKLNDGHEAFKTEVNFKLGELKNLETTVKKAIEDNTKLKEELQQANQKNVEKDKQIEEMLKIIGNHKEVVEALEGRIKVLIAENEDLRSQLAQENKDEKTWTSMIFLSLSGFGGVVLEALKRAVIKVTISKPVEVGVDHAVEALHRYVAPSPAEGSG